MKSATTVLAAALALALAGCNNDNRSDTPATDAGTPASGAAGTTGDSAAHSADSTTGAAGTAATGAGGTAATGAAAGTAGAGMGPDATGRNPAAGAGATSLDAPDRKALQAVEAIDDHEIKAAEHALRKNVQGAVRSYAETLLQDHTRNLEETRRLLGDSGTGAGGGMAGMAHDGQGGARAGGGAGTGGTTGNSPTAPGTTGTAASTSDVAATGPGTERTSAIHRELSAMREKFDAERKRLDALEGERFARDWVRSMVKGHEEALAKLDGELIPEARDPVVIRQLEATRAMIARHLETARTLEAEEKARKG